MSLHSKELVYETVCELQWRQVNDVNIRLHVLHCMHFAMGDLAVRMTCSLLHVSSALRLETAACSQAHSVPAMQGTRSGKNVMGFAGVSAIFLFGLPLVILAIAIGSGEARVLTSALPLGESLAD